MAYPGPAPDHVSALAPGVTLPSPLDGVWDWFFASGWRPATALVSLVAGYYLGRLLVRVLGRSIARRFQRPSVTRSAIRAIRTGAFFLGVLVALSVLGLGLGDLVLSVTVFSAVLGLVLAPIVGSVINGLFVLADQPYEIGDLIELADRGQRGFVEDITLRYTKVFTLDNTFLVIPNSEIRARDVINFSAEDERTRISLQLLVTYESDVARARSIMEEAARGVDEIVDGGPDIRIGSARYPARPVCYIDEYADHGVLLTLRYWVRQPYRLLTVRSKVQERVWDAIEEADDVEIAYPHSHLVFDDTSGTARVSLDGEHGDGEHGNDAPGNDTRAGATPSGSGPDPSPDEDRVE